MLASTAGNSHDWGDEVVLFNSLSGATHLLERAAGQILDQLTISPGDAESIALKMADIWHVEMDENLVSYVRDVLMSLHALVLIERV
ncbi:HPr-rel-A system PqqD family peptide chaperone [Undibacterium sp. Jales W-56]|uniref:HPr-rel-A system PqqD family peptide chaperone n=1 Tax=Undibacterium sp. Jales W-56 TaxID=2897325 RepID=UPI0021CF20F5|nr:HPr-rel-A system PqqD family peptide chaperone [Undibacterium sp. Jales W-56]MCU6434149.1 HPr-rel-A system PqqD family peptide chaperone [Undibacterium sp. Jales W-56]